MSPNWFTAEPATPAALAQNDHLYRAYLHNLLAIGDTLAAGLPEQARAAQAHAQNPAAAALDMAAAFDRIARAMRRTILLARSLAEPPLTNRHAPQAAHPRTAQPTQRPGEPGDGTEPSETLDRIDPLDDISGRSIPELIAEIAQDLGVPAPWQPRPDDDLAVATAQSSGGYANYTRPETPSAARATRRETVATPPLPDG